MARQDGGAEPVYLQSMWQDFSEESPPAAPSTTAFRREAVRLSLLRKDVQTQVTMCSVITSAAAIAAARLPSRVPSRGAGNGMRFLLNCPSENDFMRAFPQSTTQSPGPMARQLPGPTSLDGEYKDRIPSSILYGPAAQEDNLEEFLNRLEFENFEQQTQNWQAANVMRQAIDTITAETVAANIGLYFKHWHKHAPMVHEATFSPVSAALPLVLALMSIGGMREDESSQQVQLEELQGAIQIFHQLDVMTMQHSPTCEITDQASFRTWIRKESFIRTATITMMLDHAFGILNNVSPRFQWAEFDLPFPSDDVFFQISTFDEMIAKSAAPRYGMNIKTAFSVLFGPRDDFAVLRGGNVTALDMQMLIHFLYTHVWSATFSNPLASLPGSHIPALTAPFRLAMRNWRTIWDEIKSAAPAEEWSKLGFQRTAESYYDAVESILSVFERRHGRFPPIPSDCEKGSHLRRLLSF
ncbi:hypothetical protein BUE80_DR008591 [Diplocarpon rosae]|nr:hypothetical protein BUE80_DR008591 [Diplocarpon rosae]